MRRATGGRRASAASRPTARARRTPATQRPRASEPAVNASLIGGLALLALWVVLAFVAPVGAGWVHLLMASGVVLLIRRVVTGPKAW